MIENLDNLSVKSKYDQIIQHLQPLATSYSRNSGGCKYFKNDIKMINDLVQVMENRKNQSENYLTSIKSNVKGISNLKEAKTILSEAAKEIKEFVKLQESTKWLIDTFKLYQKFSTLGQFSNEIQDSLSLSYRLIGYIELSNKLLNDAGYDDYMIRVINSIYKPRFKPISSIINKFKIYVSQISNTLGIINTNLSRLKCFQCGICVESNLSKLKEYIKYLKYYVINIRISLNVISGVIDKIKTQSSRIDIYKNQLETLEKFIDSYIDYIVCYIVWILCINDDGLETGVVKQLEEIKDKMNKIVLLLKYIKDFHTHPVCIKSIESKLICVESGVLSNPQIIL